MQISRKRNLYILLLIFCFSMFILGFSWIVGYCPICNQPLGWIWRKSDNGNDTGSLGHTGVKFNRTDSLGVQQFYGIRLDKVTDWTNFVFGPLVEVPRLLASFGWKLSSWFFFVHPPVGLSLPLQLPDPGHCQGGTASILVTNKSCSRNGWNVE